MIKYQKAIKIINNISLNLPDEKISTLDSLNRICAKNILAPTKIHYLTIQHLMVLHFQLRKQEVYHEKRVKNSRF